MIPLAAGSWFAALLADLEERRLRCLASGLDWPAVKARAFHRYAASGGRLAEVLDDEIRRAAREATR